MNDPATPFPPPAARSPIPGGATPLVSRLLALAGTSPALPLEIDPDDEMLGFLLASHGGDREGALYSYFHSGMSIADAMTQVLAWRFGGFDRIGRLLDFAAGYGRVTRFLLERLPAERVWVSDIYPAAVDFQRRRHGVHGFPSTVRPEDFRSPERFDAILVTSLFTHLPAGRFFEWLTVLLGLLNPGGVLLFSVHDGSLLDEGRTLPPSGLRFEDRSESGSLDTSDYGSAWVSEEFVRRALDRAAQVARLPALSAHRLERGLCNYQDLYVAVPEAGADFSRLAFRAEPYVYVERFALEGADRLQLRGWAIARHAGALREIRLLADGAPVATFPIDRDRRDVAALFAGRFGGSGWGGTCALPPGLAFSALLEIQVADDRGTVHAVHSGRLETLLVASFRREVASYYSQLFHTEARYENLVARSAHRVDELQTKIAAMEASVFWRLRNAWFRLKRGLGLVKEI